MAISSDIHAQHGVWTRVDNNVSGEALACTGRFAAEDSEHAQGAVRHLWNSGIMNWKARHQRMPLKDELWDEAAGAYVVTLERARGDNLEKFEAWIARHGVAMAPEGAEPEEAAPKEAPAYAVAPVKLVEGVIKRLNWDAGADRCARPGYFVASTRDAVVAFEVAHYLKRRHGGAEPYIAEADFKAIEAQLQQGDGRVFKIAVEMKHLDRFAAEFPGALEPKGELDAGWLAALHDRAGPDGEPHGGFGRRLSAQPKFRQRQLGLK